MHNVWCSAWHRLDTQLVADVTNIIKEYFEMIFVHEYFRSSVTVHYEKSMLRFPEFGGPK